MASPRLYSSSSRVGELEDMSSVGTQSPYERGEQTH